MQTNPHFVGLTDVQVLENRRKYGENILTPPQKKSLWIQFSEKFREPITVILLVAWLLSLSVAFYEYFFQKLAATVFLEPTGILVAVLLATLVGFFFELSAGRKFDALNRINTNVWIKVIRNGRVCEVLQKEVVVGDFVILEAGEEIPADGELQEAISLQVNESTLTGEPIIRKTVNPEEFRAEATYPSNHVLKGTTVAEGHGIMQVNCVGDATEYGKVYEGAQIDNHVQTPLNKQLSKLASGIAKVSYAIAIALVFARLISYFLQQEGFFVTDWADFGNYVQQTLMISVALIVVSIPEGLPMSITLSLAMTMKRMLSSNNLVRKMHACETMGAATVVCTDKTGTLTQNQMKVYETEFYDFGVKRDSPVFEKIGCREWMAEGISSNTTAYLDFSDASKIKPLGNPTEGALLLWLHEHGINYLSLREKTKIIKQLPFSTERKYMATLVQSPLLNKKVLYVKGAPEIVLDLCQSIPASRSEINEKLLNYQSKAMRTLGFAYQIVEEDDGDCMNEEGLQNTNLVFMGIAAISDPLRTEVPDAVKTCLDAGIDVKIVTGDTSGIAKEIGRQIGLWNTEDPEHRHMTGTEFAAMEDALLLERVLELKILSRARPMDKRRLVQLLQQKDQVVAVTGDGTNDAPALNAAQVGLSMGDGTSVAKEASDITLLDNSFGSISNAVMWGRSLYKNIQRFILFQLTINAAACITVLIGAFLGTEPPLTVTQMLWVNLIMDTFAALALASLPPSQKVMEDKPRKISDHIISKNMAWQIFGVGIGFVILLFGLLQYFKHADITALSQFRWNAFFENFFMFRNSQELSPYELSLFFTIFVLFQFWNMFNAKAFMSGKSAFATLGKCHGFLITASVILFGQWLIVGMGGEMFSVVPLKLSDWGVIIATTSCVLWIGEATRMFKRLFNRMNMSKIESKK